MTLETLMTKNVVCCTPDTRLVDVARMMDDERCGALPVVDSDESRQLRGIITDRDIAIRGLTADRDPREMHAEHCMSKPVATISQNASMEDAHEALAQNRIRRIPVVNSDGQCVGIVAQADLALHGEHELAAKTVQRISAPNPEPVALH